MTDGRQSSRLHHLLSEEKVVFSGSKAAEVIVTKIGPFLSPLANALKIVFLNPVIFTWINVSENFNERKYCFTNLWQLLWSIENVHKNLRFKNTAHKFSLRKIQMYCFPLPMRSKLRQNSDHSKPRTHIPLFVLSYFTKATVAKIQIFEFKLCFVMKCIL